MSKDLIAKLEAAKVPHKPYDNFSTTYNNALNKAIEIVRQHDEPQTVADELAGAREDLAYCKGAKAGWNAASSNDPLYRGTFETSIYNRAEKARQALAKYREGVG